MASFSSELIKFANPSLSDQEKQLLISIIDCVQNDLLAGHSCSKLSLVADKVSLSLIDARKLLLSSGLVAITDSECIDTVSEDIQLIPAKPHILYHDLLYLNRYYYYEISVAKKIRQLDQVYFADKETDTEKLLEELKAIQKIHNLPNQEQFNAIKNSISRKLSIITGGPGTGKTTTVTLLLWALANLYRGQKLAVKICAPTGKAANRVKESIINSLKLFKERELPIECQLFDELLSDSNSFTTIHKLLGYQQNSIYFRHDEKNSLAIDILIIDESSMIGLSLFSKLLAAINPLRTRHIIFLGDKNQLSSVEEGYVFASLVKPALLISGTSRNESQQLLQPDLFSVEPVDNSNSMVSELIISNRSSGEVAKLSSAVLAGNITDVGDLLEKGAQVQLKTLEMSQLMAELFKADSCWNQYTNFLKNCDEETDVSALFAAFNQQVVLSAINSGFFGVNNLNLIIEKRIRQQLMTSSEWYSGRPIMILSNDYALGLFNGDIGICQSHEERLVIVFQDGRKFIPEILPRYQLAYAITIHKSQGSEYNNVNIVLPEIENLKEVYSRELIYTAITRAKKSVTISSSFSSLKKIILNQLERNTGLQIMLK